MQDKISITSIGCRFPGNVTSADEFWHMLCQGKVGIVKTPANRWDADEWVIDTMNPQAPIKGKMSSSLAGWLADVFRFDLKFWQLSKREVEQMDPQQRLSLEVTYEALAAANLSMAAIKGSATGVFVGGGQADFQSLTFADPNNINPYSSTGVSPSIIANRISYLFDLHGPSLVVDTACSSAMTAFHLACQSLANDECERAIVVGILTMLSPATSIGFTQTQFLSPTGTLRPFDAAANGFVRGEGCGVIILEKNAPFGYANVIGSGINEDGHTLSLTQPSSDAQTALMQHVLEKYQISANQISFIEAHGTGTPTGDPIEAQAISQAYQGRTQPLLMGSVKGNIGHLENAAGIAGIIKAALMLKHHKTVPTAGFDRWNPSIDATQLNLKMSLSVEELPPNPIIGVNSYGFGGANGHALFTSFSQPTSNSYPYSSNRTPPPKLLALPLSSHYPQGITQVETAWQQLSTSQFPDFVCKQGVASDHLAYRKVYVGEWSPDLGVKSFFQNATVLEAKKQKQPKIAFIYAGQGSQSASMGYALAQHFKVFRQALATINQTFIGCGAPDYLKTTGLLKTQTIDQTFLQAPQYVMPLIVMIQFGLSKLLQSLGIVPAIVMGHSTGELVAAWQAGAISLEQMCQLAFARANGQQKMVTGAMAALAISAQKAQSWLPKTIEIAAINAENAITVSGSTDAIQQLSRQAEAEDIYCKILPIQRAYHSQDVTCFQQDLLATNITPQPGVLDIPFISTVEPQRTLQKQDFCSQYWWRGIRNPVKFSEGLQQLQHKADLIIEISPSAVLSGYITNALENIHYIPLIHKRKSEELAVLKAMATLYVNGGTIKWQALQPDQTPKQILPLPRPAWQHEVSIKSAVLDKMSQATTHEKRNVNNHHGKISLTAAQFPYLREHTLAGKVVFPAAGYIYFALQQFQQNGIYPSLKNLSFDTFFFLWQNQQTENELSIQLNGATYHFLNDLQQVAQGEIADSLDCEEQQDNMLLIEQPSAITTPLSADQLYKMLEKYSQFPIGASFRLIKHLSQNTHDNYVEAQIETNAFNPWQTLPIPVLDAFFQVLGFATGLSKEIKVPKSIDWLHVFPAEKTQNIQHHQFTVRAKITTWTNHHFTGELDIYTQNNQHLIAMRGVTMQMINQPEANSLNLFSLQAQPQLLDSTIESPSLNIATLTIEQTLDDEFNGDIILDFRVSLLAISNTLKQLKIKQQSPRYIIIINGIDKTGRLGFARTARIEFAELNITTLSGHALTTENVLPLLSQLKIDEYEYYYDDQHQTLSVPRLVTVDIPSHPPVQAKQHRLIIEKPGQLSSLAFAAIDHEKEGLDPDEVRVQVGFISMHFKDLALAMNLLPGYQPILGSEICGQVLTTGKAVTDLQAGDWVYSFQGVRSELRHTYMGSTAICDATSLFKLPSSLPPLIACSSVGVVATAYYGLYQLANLKAGEWVLIHSAMGGVGQAAIQLAKHRGARIIASAGSEQKRQQLLTEFQVDAVMDSRNPGKYLTTVKQVTDGQGVQVVLNSLSGSAQQKSLQCLAPGGRFVEIGKRDIQEGNALSLALLKNNITFYSAHLDLLLETHFDIVAQLFKDVLTLLEQQTIRQIATKVVPFTQAPEIFATMAKAQHTGKIVLQVDQQLPPTNQLSAHQDLLFHRNKPYLFTGSTRGIGLEFALWAIHKGARQIILTGQSGDLTQISQIKLNTIQQQYPQLTVQIEKIDFANSQAIPALLAKHPNLAGIFHFANTYVANASDEIDETTLNTGFAAKADGAWQLHAASKNHHQLDIFCLITSIASLMGNPLQSVYTAANASLYALAKYRRQQNLPAVTVDLPIVLGCGHLSQFENSHELESNAAWGVGTVSIQTILTWFEKILLNQNQLPEEVALDAPQWDRYARHNPYKALFETHIELTADPQQQSQLSTAEISDLIKQKLAHLLGCKPDEIEGDTPVTHIGIDSLAAIEFSNWTQELFKIKLSQLDILSGLTVDAIISQILADAHPTTNQTASIDTKTVVTAPPVPPEIIEATSHSPTSPSINQYLQITHPNDKTIAITLLEDSLTANTLQALLDNIDPNKVLVFKGMAANFCLGMDLSVASFEDETMLTGLEQFMQLYQRLESHPLPIITVVDGAVRGGGMLFPCIADITLASQQASFGFPEIRHGGLPGIVSLAAQKKLSKAQCKMLMLTGDRFDVDEAKSMGLVKQIYTSDETLNQELNRLINRFNSIPNDLLTHAKAYCPADSIDSATVTMGLLNPLAHPKQQQQASLVQLSWPSTHIAQIELADSEHHNAMDVALALDFRKIVEQIKQQPQTKAIILQAQGQHFCTGVNPYSFIKKAQEIPLVARSALIYQLYEAFLNLSTLSIPVIAVTHGLVVGGGLGLALVADWRICERNTRFVYGNMSRGVCPGFMLSKKLPELLGESSAFDLYLQNLELNADQAKAANIVQEITDTLSEAKQKALQLAQSIAQAPSQGLHEATSLMRTALDKELLAKEAVAIARCLTEGAFSGDWKRSLSRNDIPQPQAAATKPIQHSKNVGIIAYECYVPVLTVQQQDLETLNQCPGKYTTGLGQQAIAFAGDDQDAVSAAMTVVSQLLEKTGISPSHIGRLEVGTETLVDRSKSIKSFLMPLFGDNTNIEGVDSYNACYGGTAALFNSIAWVESEAWDGRYAIMVAVDIADLNEEQSFLNGFAAVALLIGPDAAIVMQPERQTHIEHTYDFYKPVGWQDSFPLMRDGEYSITCYMDGLKSCMEGLQQKLPDTNILHNNDYFIFHCTSSYLCKRAFDEVCRLSNTDISLKNRLTMYQQKVEPSTVLCKKIGSSYTASVYINLISLLEEEQDKMLGKSIVAFSYGSGSSSSMYRLKVNQLPDFQGIKHRLENRFVLTAQAFKQISQQYSSRYGQFDFVPAYTDYQQDNIYYLKQVDAWGVRTYGLGTQTERTQLHYFPTHREINVPVAGLCFIHSIGGEVSHYAPLVNKIYQNPSLELKCYGILSTPDANSIDQLIDYYCQQIQHILKTSNQLFLAGYSSGCYTATFLASLLEEQGITVSGLLLIDPYSPSRLEHEPKTTAELIQMVFRSYQLQGDATTIEEALKILPNTWNADRLQHYIKSWQQAQLLKSEIPELPQWHGPTQMYLCPERWQEKECGLSLFRSKLANREETKISGNHQSCMHYPHVQKLASIMVNDVAKMMHNE